MSRTRALLRRAEGLREWSAELVALAAFVIVVLVLRSRGLRLDLHALRFTLVPMAGSLPRILAVGLAIHCALSLAGRRSPLGYLREFARPASLLGWARFTAVLMLVTFAYTWLKVCVPLLTARALDPALWSFDRLLHLGFSPTVFAVELFAGAPLRALDLWYSFWVMTILAAMAWGASHPSLPARRNFALACALLWTLGSWGYVALPAAGPCYVSPELFAEAAPSMPHATAMQAALGRNYALLLAGRDGSLREFNPYFGVAAMPSLHVGAHWLFALWARRHARRFFAPLAFATALTFAGSVATGWHYAIDGYAGMLLAWLAVAVADRAIPLPSIAADRAPGAVRPAAATGGAAAE